MDKCPGCDNSVIPGAFVTSSRGTPPSIPATFYPDARPTDERWIYSNQNALSMELAAYACKACESAYGAAELTHPTAKNKLEEIARSHADPSLGPCPFCNSPQRFRGSILVVGGFGGRQIAWFRPDLLKSWGLRLTSGAKVDASAIACSRCGKIVASLYPKALAILVRTA